MNKNKKTLKNSTKALMLDKSKNFGNWLFEWNLLDEIHDITENSEFPVSMEEIESVLIALTKIDTK